MANKTSKLTSDIEEVSKNVGKQKQDKSHERKQAWNSLEVTKLVVSLFTPLAILYFSI